MDLINFILTYFVTKNMNILTAFICWPPDQIIQLWHDASKFSVRLSVYTDLRRHPRFSPYEILREAVLLDLDCPDTHQLLLNASVTRGFHYRHSWLLLHNSSYDGSIIEETLEDYDILPDADVVWASPDRLVDVYRVKANHPLLLTDLGLNRSCSRRQLVDLWGSLPTAVARRKDLRNVTLLGVAVISMPELFHSWDDVSTRQYDTYPKVVYPLMMIMGQDLNIHYNLRQVDFYGVLLPNGSFNGMAGMLQRHEIELGISSVFMRKDRMRVMHYFSEALKLSTAFIFRQPSRSAVSNVFLAPFSAGVWSACGLVSLAAALLLVVFRHVMSRTNHHTRRLLAPLTLPDTCTFALGSMCQQGFYTTPGVTSVRVVMFSTLLASLFVFTAYSAKIVAILQTPSTAIRTIDDLTKSPMVLGVQDTTYKKVYFTESADVSTQRLYKHKILPQGERAYMDVGQGIARVKAGLFAYQVERSSGYDVITKTFTEREKCSLDEIEAFKNPMVSVPIKRYSGYRELFAARMRWLREIGLMAQARNVWLESKPRCESVQSGFVSIGITDVLPALQVLGFGALLAVVLLGAEISLHAIKKKADQYQRRRSDAATAQMDMTRFN